MTKDELIAWAKTNGWHEDKHGHLQKVTEDGNLGPRRRYRLKLGALAARYEIKSAAGWVRLKSGYYRNLTITADGKLAGMTQ